jgi:predicted extracellular nuclease
MDNRQGKWLGMAVLALMTSSCGFPLPGAQDAVEPLDPARKLIAVVQGEGASSALLGEEVLIEGVVVRNLMGDSDDLGQELKETLGEADAAAPTVGWFIQDEGDGNPVTSDGLFVLDQGYDTSINMPAETEYTMRMGSRVRTGDRVTVRGTVVELEQARVADQPRSTGHRVSHGAPDGTVTAIAAMSVTLVAPDERATAIVASPAVAGQGESSEGMRL